MKINKYTRSLQIFLLMMIMSCTAWAQVPASYLCSVRNDSLVTSKIYEFDIYLQNTDLVNVFELGTFQAGIIVNSSIVNGGFITASIVAGSSQLVAAQQPSAITFAGSPDFCIKLAPRSGPGHLSGTVISSTAPGTRVVRIRLTNTVDFGQFSPNFVFNFTALPYNTIVSAYDQTSANNTIITNPANQTVTAMNNPVLNSPVTLFSMTGGGSYCSGPGVAVGLSGSETGVQYRLLNNGVPVGSYIPGTGAALSFGAQLVGTYTVTAYRKGTYLTGTMTGSSIVTLSSITPALTGPNSACTGVTGVIYTTDAGQTNYIWTISAGGTITAGGTATSNTATVTWNTAGAQSISVTYTPAGGCTASVNNYPVNVSGTVTPTMTGLSSACIGLTGNIYTTDAGQTNYIWTIVGGIITSGGTTTSNTATVTWTIAGAQSISVTYTPGGGCGSVVRNYPVTVNVLPVPTITGLATVCTSATGVTYSTETGMTGYSWAISAGGTIASGTGTNTITVTWNTAGPQTVSVNYLNANGCTASAPFILNITVNATPTAPIVGTITQPTCALATGSVILSGLPAGTWTINPGAIAGSTTSTTITGLVAATYNYTVTNSTACPSVASANVVINAQPITPMAPIVGIITQPTCVLATGSVVLSGLPAGNWIINPGAFAGTGTSTTISGIAVGTHTYTITNAAGCISVASSNVVINSQPVTPAAPIIGTIAQPTCALATGSVILNGLPAGNWTINPGTLVGSTTSTTISGLATGTYNYTVTNSTGCTSVASASVIINAAPGTPAAPIVGTITQPTCALATGSVILSGLPAGTWTINPGSIAGSTTSTTISGLVAGTYNYTVTNAAGCISLASANVVINAQPVTPTAPIVGTITQPTCALATGSVLLSGLPAGTWTINPGAIAGSTTSTTLSGIAMGTYTYTVTNSSGCVSVASANVVINAQPATPTALTVGTITQPTCALATGSVVLSGLPAGAWTINPGAIAGTGTSTTLSGLAAGTYNYTVTNALGCISAASANIVINAQPATPTAPTVGTITQPTCALATGSVVLSGLPGGTWTINPGAVAGTGASTTLSGLTAGTYNYTVTNTSGCVSVASANVVVIAQPTIPTAPVVGTITQPTCALATGSVVLSGLPAGTWTINPGAIAGSTTSTTISGLAAGTYNYTVTNASGCISPASANVVINTAPGAPTAPVVGTITQPTCALAIGSVVLSGLPTGTWTINPGAIAGSTTSTTISGLAAGTYNYTVTNTSGCVSVASANVVVNAQPATPTAPVVGTITQPTCALATGSVLLSGLPAGTWTINPGAIAGSTTSTTISGLAAGTYNYTVTNASGCVSPASANVVVNAQPATPTAPIVGTITQPTCALATGSVILSGLPAGNWTINPGAIAGSTTSTTLSGIAVGTHTYTVTNASGCTSVASANVVINAQPVTPMAPIVGTITQPTCALATGSVLLSGLPAGTWTINPGAIAGSTTSTTISGLSGGTYNYTVTNAAGCISVASANIVINAQPVTPTAPIVGTITQPTCALATGSVILSGLPAGTWTINPGAIAGSTTSTTNSGLATGTYNYTVTNAAGCTSVASANVVINAQPVTPTAPIVGTITQPTCALATGSVILSGLPAGNWTINPGAIAGTGASTTISGIAVGTHTYTVTNTAGCTSLVSANVVINAAPGTPAAPIVGTITQPTCALATGSVLLSGLPAGTWTINPGAIAGSTTSTTISGLAVGTYNYTITNSSGCVSATSANVVVNAQPVAPTAPIVGTITQPTCALATGSVILSGLPVGTWTINPGAIVGSTTSTTILGLAAGTYNYTVTNATGCISPASANVVVNAQPTTPTAPVVGTITQPTCALATGSVILSGLPAGNWTINPGAIAGTGASTTISGIAVGTHTYNVTNAAGCTSPASANVVINAAPGSPAAPIVGTITQPTCALATGSVILSGLPAGNWTINPGALAGNTVTTTISGLASGTYNYTVTNAAGCISLASANVVVNAQPVIPTAPTVGTITQPTCALATGSVLLSGLPAGTWTINPGAIAGSSTSTTISGISAGTFNYTVTNAAGCISLASANVVINAQPVTPVAPIVGTITQPTCALATGSVILSGLPAGNWTIDPGAIAGTGPSMTISGLAAGTYNFTVTNSSGCISIATANVVITAHPLTPAAPTVGTITQPTCILATGSVVLNGLPTGNWIIDPGAIAGAGASTTIPGLAASTYNYTVTNSSGCISLPSANVVVNAQPASPIVSLGIDMTICGGQSVLLDAGNPGSTYLWTPGGQTTQTKLIDSAGFGLGAHIISVVVTAVNTCSTTGSIVVTFDPCTGIAENNDGISFGINPNPSEGMFYLTVKGLTENATLDIFDMNGKIIYTEQIDKTGVVNKAIDLTSYPKGMYFTRLVSVKHASMGKIIIN